jgi:hypothetical protein
VYDIDTRIGSTEKLVSGTTNPRTFRAVFAPESRAVALTNEVNGVTKTVLGIFGSSTNGLTFTEIDAKVTEPGFSHDGKDFYFFVEGMDGGRGYAYSFAEKGARELFAIPLRDVRILWGNSTYVFTTPSGHSLGYLYKVGKGNQLEYVTKGGRGLMATNHASGTVVSVSTARGMTTRDSETGVTVPLLSLFTEKCAPYKQWTPMLVCGSPVSLIEERVYPDDWYKGLIGFSDRILRIDSQSASVMNLSNLEEESGRPLDVASIGTDATGDLIYFINKYDNTVWLLDLR